MLNEREAALRTLVFSGIGYNHTGVDVSNPYNPPSGRMYMQLTNVEAVFRVL